MKKILFVAALFLSLNSQANYLKGGLGVSLGGETEFHSNGDTTRDHESSIMFPLLLAYGWEIAPHLSIEAEGSVRHNEYKGLARSGDVGALGANAVGNFSLGKFDLFLGAGAGYGIYKLMGAKKDFALSGQGFVGANYLLESGIRLGAEYRYFRTLGDVDADSGVTATYTSTAFILSAMFPF
jgi:opacity protein-like surface antigen